MYQSKGTLPLLRCLDSQASMRILDVDTWEKKGVCRTRVGCLTIARKCMIHKLKMTLARRIILKMMGFRSCIIMYKKDKQQNTKRVD